ncbi:hypothetical protein [uncultured Tateyamaria sp.]|uniref:hypothetical protein n=1 Tax=uncultured Tateyamaria sp. TaxID=455651 RepID=UPI0026169311|nr:hypothetical protein [uncultured Tateyamaria sp.]
MIYAGVFAFGAVALLIEARRNYRESLKQEPFQRHPILHNARVDDLCTPRDGFVGFIIYSLLYLVSYVVILSSAELFDLIRNVNMAKAQVGATTSFDPFAGDVLNLEGTVYAKPIFVSAFLIAIMSVGAMRPIENSVRSAAHRLAGIPRGVYRVIDALQTPAFQALTSRRSGPLLSHFRQLMKAQCPDQDIHDLAGHQHDIEVALGAIDVLSPAVTPHKRAKYFPASELDMLTEMAGKLQIEMDGLRSDLMTFVPSDRSLEDLQEKANTAANNVKALFAVHYIRNNRSVKNLDPGSPLHRSVAVIDRNYNPEQNSIAMAAFLSVILAFFTTFYLYYDWHKRTVTIYPVVATKDVTTAATAAGIDVTAQRCIAVYDTRRLRYSDEPPPPPLDPAVTDEEVKSCMPVIEAAQSSYILSIRTDLVREAFWETLQGALITLLAVTSVAFGREVRLEQESWKRGWSLARMPFLRLFGLCLLPSILAVVGSVGGELAELANEAGPMNLTSTQIVDLFQTNFLHFALMLGVGFVLSFCTLIILDKHDDFYNEITVLFLGVPSALACVSIFGLVTFVTYTFAAPELPDGGISYVLRDILIMSAVPTIFMITFAIFIEITEEQRLGKDGMPEHQWLVQRILFGEAKEKALP